MESIAHPRVRILHTSPNAPAIDMYIDHSLRVPGLTYGQISDYISLWPDRHRLQLFPSGQHRPQDVLTDDQFERLAPGLDYTVVAAGEVKDLRAFLFKDSAPLPVAGRERVPIPGRAQVRFLHASPDAPAVDVGVTGNPALFLQIGYTEMSPFKEVESGTYDVQVRRAGHEAIVTTLSQQAFAGGKRYTLVALGLLDGQPALQLMPVVDAVAVCPV
jgi:hypothetical protein